jgi:hypothetical protein
MALSTLMPKMEDILFLPFYGMKTLSFSIFDHDAMGKIIGHRPF